MKTISNKAPDEIILVTFDFEKDTALAVGETISSPVFAVTPKGGEDPAAAGMFTGTAQITGRKVIRKVQAGIAGLDYVLSCTVDTSAGQKLKLSGVLPVREHA